MATSLGYWSSAITGAGNPKILWGNPKIKSDASGNTYSIQVIGAGSVTHKNGDGSVKSTVTYTAAFNIVVIKYNSLGVIQWITPITMGGTTNPIPHGFEIDSDGNVYIGAIIYDNNGNLSIEGTTIVTRPANSTLYGPIIKLSTATGALAYAFVPVTGNATHETITTAFKCVGTDLYALVNTESTSSGTTMNVYSQNGNSFRTFTGPGSGATRTVLMKLNSSGICQFAFILTSTVLQRTIVLEIDSAGSMYVGGFLQANTTYTVNNLSGTNSETSSAITLVASSANDGFVIAYNSAGVAQWARSLRGSNTDDNVRSILAVPGGIVVSVYTNNASSLTIYNGSTLLNTIALPALNILTGVYVFFSTAGAYQNNMRFLADNTNSHASAYSITSDSAGNLYMAGMFNTNFKFYDTTGSATSVKFTLVVDVYSSNQLAIVPVEVSPGYNYSSFIFKVSSTGRYLTHRVIQGTNFLTGAQLVSLTSPTNDLVTVHLPTQGSMLRTCPLELLHQKVMSIVFTPSTTAGSSQRLLHITDSNENNYLYILPTYNNGFFRVVMGDYNVNIVDFIYTSPTAIVTSTTTKYIVNIYVDATYVRFSIGSINGTTITYLANSSFYYDNTTTFLSSMNNIFFGRSFVGSDPYLNAAYHKISVITPASSTTYYTDTNLATFTNLSTNNLSTSTADGSLYTFDNGSNQVTVTIRANGGTPAISTTALTIASSAYFDTPATSIYVEKTIRTPIQYLLRNPTTSTIGTYSTVLLRTTMTDVPSTITDLSVNITSQTTATLSWTAASDGGSGSTMTYKVYNGSTELTGATVPAISVSGTTATLTGCIVGQPYSLTVRATNAAGTSGVSNTVSLMTGVPTTLPAGAILWFDAADTSTITSSGGVVSTWSSKGSRSATNFTAGTGSVTTGTTTVASKNVITHTAGSSLAMTTNAYGNNFTIVAALRVNTFPNNTNITTINTATSNAQSWYLSKNGSGAVTMNSSATTGSVIATIPDPSGTICVLSLVGSSSAANQLARSNGTGYALSTNVAFSGSISTSAAYVTNGSGASWASGYDYCETVVYTSALTVSQIEQAEGYLAWKWGTQATLPASHAYRTAAILPVPQSVSATATSSTSARVTWSAPASGQGPIVNYTVTTKQNGVQVGSTIITKDISSNITGLSPWTVYTFEVVAVNLYGSSSTVTVSATTPTVPDAPASLSSQVNPVTGDISLNWIAPAEKGAAITSYRVYSSGSLLSGVSTPAVSINGTTARITGVTMGTSYSFTVSAVNSVGEGAQSIPLVVTPMRIPSTMSAPTAVAGNKFVNLTWVAPSNGGTAITGYTIAITRNGVSAGTTTAAAADTSKNIVDLSNGATYTFTIAAVNSIGTGSYSAASNPVAPDALPTGTIQIIDLTSGGMFDVDSTLSTNAALLADEDGVGTLSYQWQVADTSGGAFADISGATAATYIPIVAHVGKFYRVRVSYTDGTGTTYTGATAIISVVVGPVRARRPYQPTSTAATAGSSSAVVSWTAPVKDVGAAISKYIVRYETQSSPSVWTRSIVGQDASANATSLVYTGLTPGTEYRFVVSAVNSTGEGDTSVPTNAIIPYTTASAPQGLDATAGSSQVRLTWSAPSSNGFSTITEYRISYSWPPSNAALIDISANGLTDLSYSLTGLTPGTQYSFYVFARNAAGLGTSSSLAAAIPYTTPGVPRDVSANASYNGSSRITVSWTAPLTDGYNTITEYRITDGSGNIYDVSGGGRSVIITGLIPTRMYSYTVRAKNNAGYGTASSPAASATAFGAPSAPVISSTTAGITRADISWNVPVSDGGRPLLGYKIYRATPAPVALLADVSANILNRAITGLSAGIPHTFYVVAYTVAGDSTPSAQSTAVIPYTIPGVPQNVRTNIGVLEITLLWDPPALDGSSNILEYRIVVDGSTTVDVSANINSYKFSGLTLGQTYSYTITAKNAAGYGTTSTAITEIASIIPSAPQAIVAVASASKVTLSWSPPESDGNANIIGYRITDNLGTIYDIPAFPITPVGSNMLVSDSKTTYKKSTVVPTSRWNTYVYGEESYMNGIYVAFTPNNPSGTFYYTVGITSSPSTVSSAEKISTIDYYWYMDGSVGMRAKRNNVNLIPNITTNFRNLRYEIIYNGSTIRMLAGGVEYYTADVSSNITYSFTSKMLVANASIKDLIVSSSPAAGLRSLTITGLNPGQTYTYTIKAKNAAGYSTTSTPTTVITTG